MATTQVLIGKTEAAGLGSGNPAADTFGSLGTGSPFFSTVEARGTLIWPVAGTFSQWVITLATAPGAGKSWTYTLRKNGVDTALAITIAGTATSGRDTTHSVSVVAGDQLVVRATPSGSPTGADFLTSGVDFTSSTAGESGYAGQPTSGTIATTAARFNGVFRQNSTWGGTAATSGTGRTVAAAAGTLTALYAYLDGSPGTGKTYTFALYKNGVRQDGTGGTVETRVVVADLALSGSRAFTLPVAAGDVFTLEALPTGTPTARRVGASVRFVATTDGESQFCGCTDVAPSTTVTTYTRLPCAGSLIWPVDETTEATVRCVTGISPFTLSQFRVHVDTAPGAGKSRTYSLRRNLTSPAGAPSVTVADTATSGSDGAGSLSVVDGDVLNLRAVPAGTPALGTATLWAAIQGPTAPALVAVPDVVTGTQADAITAIEAAGLIVGTITTALSGSVAPGHVSSQSPTAGTLVAPGSAVDLVIAVAPGLVVTIDGVPQRILHESLSIQATVNGRDRLSATLPMPTVAPAIRQEIVVTDDGVRIFGGYLDTARQRAGSSWTDRDDQLLYDITAADYTVLADWRYSNGPQVAETLKAYLLGGVVPFLPGVTLDPAQVDGPLLPTRTVVMQTITQVLDELSTITGYVWNIDYDGRLKMWLPSAAPAPVDVLDSNDTAIGDITVEPIATGYATSIFLLAGDSSQQILTETFIGDGTTLEWDLAHRLVTHGGTLTLAGTPENVGPGEAWELDALPEPFMYTLRRAIGSAPAVGAAIVFAYTAQYPLIYRKDDAAAVAALGGQYIEQLFTEPTVFDPAQAAALADGYLAQVTHPTREVRYTTLRGDIVPGQTQTIAIASRGLSGSFVITDVETRMHDPLLIRAVTAADPGPYPGSWRDVYKLWLEGATRLDAAAAASSPGGGGGGGGAPAPHAATHAAGGGDPVVITALAGFPGGTATFLRADGGFAAPAGTTTVVTRTDTGTVHNWAPGLVGDTVIYWTGTTDLTITGLAGGSNGQLVTIKHVGSATAVIACAHNATGSSAAGNVLVNIATSGPTPIAALGFATYQYMGGTWKLVAHEQGAWITPVYNAANFTNLSPVGTWTVSAGVVLEYAYRLSGRTLTVSCHTGATMVPAGGSNVLGVNACGYTASRYGIAALSYVNLGAYSAGAWVVGGRAGGLPGSPWVHLWSDGKTGAWAAADMYVNFTTSFEVS